MQYLSFACYRLLCNFLGYEIIHKLYILSISINIKLISITRIITKRQIFLYRPLYFYNLQRILIIKLFKAKIFHMAYCKMQFFHIPYITLSTNLKLDSSYVFNFKYFPAFQLYRNFIFFIVILTVNYCLPVFFN